MRVLGFAVLPAFLLATAPAGADEPLTSLSEPEQDSAQSYVGNPSTRTTLGGPASRSEASPPTEANSPGLLVGGLVVGGYGLTSGIISAVAIWSTGACGCTALEGNDCDMTGCAIGIGHIYAGPILLLGSIPMIIAGAWQVPSDDRGMPATTAEVRVGPGNTSLAVTF